MKYKPNPHKTQAEQIAESQGMDADAHLTRRELRRKKSLKKIYRSWRTHPEREARKNAAILRWADRVEADIQRKLKSGEPIINVEMTAEERRHFRTQKKRRR